MASDGVIGAFGSLPDGYRAVPIGADQQAASLRIGVVVRPKADPVAGHVVVLRDTLDARVLLGAVLDAGGQVHQWLEVWIQCLDNLGRTPAAGRQPLSNSLLDDRWRRHFEAVCKLDPGGVFRTGWEHRHPPPTWLDLDAAEPVHPREATSGHPWALCTDDVLLRQAGLPAYTNTLHRYLHVPALGAQTPFASVTADAPATDRTVAWKDLVPVDQAHRVPLNPGAGLLLVRVFSPVDYEGFVDLLGGASWDGLWHGRTVLDLGACTQALKEQETSLPADGRLFLGAHGRPGRLVECYHLKLRLLADAFAQVQALVRLQQRPILNLTAQSFQVRLGLPGRGLPFLWTARATLADPGDALALAVEGTDVEYYLRGISAGPSVYFPESASKPVQGQGSVRIREVLPQAGDLTILEGTLAVQERIALARQDLVWLRLNLACGRVDLFARLEAGAALAAGEWRFRTIGQRLDPAAVDALRAAQGVLIRPVGFEVVPLLSTPCDLYALGVLAVRTLLVNPDTTLPVAVDEVLSLATQVAAEYDEAVKLSVRIGRLFNRDKRWAKSLGPHRLTGDTMSIREAFRLLPGELWMDTLAFVVRLFAGVGPDSHCQDYGDAPSGGLHKVFDRARADLDDLLLRSRSLIVIDWRYNAEVHGVVREYLEGKALRRT